MLLHDSHHSAYRVPLGPVAAGQSLTVRLACDEADAVTLRTWDGSEARIPMERGAEGLFQATVQVPDTPMLFWYDFILHDPQGELRYGAPADGLGGPGERQYGQLHSYQVTVYDPGFETPAYLHRGILYQVFPDRFYRDRHAQAGREAIIRAAHPEASYHPLWQEEPTLDPDPENGDNRALDFFGGTLEGIRQKLDYLQALGVTVLYLNPIFRARTNHRYDTGSYEEIDPILGTQEDFDRLAQEARRRGMKLLLDGVFSHTGADSQYFNRYGRYPTLGAYQSQQSPYFSWYSFEAFPDKYNSWWGFYTLPAVQKDNPTYQRYLLHPEEGILPEWVRRGACGWRLDVADELPMPLLRDMRRAVKGANPEAALVAEVWEDASNKTAYGQLRSYCLGDTVDSAMNYPLRTAIIAFFTGSLDAYGLRRLILHQQEVYPAPFHYALMNLLGSHDRVRILNALAGYDQEGIEQRPREEARHIRLEGDTLERAKQAYLKALRLLCALPGAPTLYYGDEIGMQGMADPWNRAPMDWDGGDATHWDAVCSILRQRQKTPPLQTGFLQVEALDENTLRIRRYPVEGKDVFGHPLAGEAEVVVTR